MLFSKSLSCTASSPTYDWTTWDGTNDTAWVSSTNVVIRPSTVSLLTDATGIVLTESLTTGTPTGNTVDYLEEGLTIANLNVLTDSVFTGGIDGISSCSDDSSAFIKVVSRNKTTSKYSVYSFRKASTQVVSVIELDSATSSTGESSICKIGTNKYLIAYNINNSMYIRVLSGSTLGTALLIPSGYYSASLKTIGTDFALVFYATSTSYSGRVTTVSVSGMSITLNTVRTLGAPIYREGAICYTPNGGVVCIGITGASAYNASIYTLSGTTLLQRNSISLSSSGIFVAKVESLGTNNFVVLSTPSDLSVSATAYSLTLSGNYYIQHGTVELASAASASTSPGLISEKLNDSSMLVGYTASSDNRLKIKRLNAHV